MPPEKPAEMFSASAEIVGPVFYSRNLSDKAKLLFGLIWAMTKPPRYYAFAHNDTFARFLNCSGRSVQRYLDELRDAGEIEIEDCQGGRKTTRKIKAVRLQPLNHDTGDVVKHDTGDVVTNNCIINNNSVKGKRRQPPEAVSQEEICAWFDRWAADRNFDQEHTVALISDLHAFVENRAAKGKPILTINAAGRHAKKLLDLSADFPEYRAEAMCYILGEAITRNWEKLYPIDDNRKSDFERYLLDAWQIAFSGAEEPAEEGWN